MTSRLEPKTWRRKSGLASWTFRAPAGDDPLRRSTAAVMRALGDFATSTHVSLSTASQGEDAAALERPDSAAVDAAIARLGDVDRVFFDLDLRCLDEAGTEVNVPDGATLWMDVEDAIVSAYLDLDVDLYAPRSWGIERDNRRLAARNGPRLTGFLRRLRDQLGATDVEVDAPDYDVTVDGFEPPTS